MKKYKKHLIAICFFLIFSYPVLGISLPSSFWNQNTLIKNYGFENWSENHPTNWVISGATSIQRSTITLSNVAGTQYSLRISGTAGRDVFIQQTVNDESSLDILRGKKVLFSAFFKPDISYDDVYVDLIVEYETESSSPSPPGGCPYLLVWTGDRFSIDNNLLRNAEFYKKFNLVDDYYVLRVKPIIENNIVRLRIAEFEHEIDFIDSVELFLIEHSGNIVSVNDSGYVFIVGDGLIHPKKVVNSMNKSIKHLIYYQDGIYYNGTKGDYILLDFGKINSDFAKLILVADDQIIKTSLEIQMLINGSWKNVSRIIPRRFWSIDIIDLSKFLPMIENSSLIIRILFTRNHKIDFIALDTSINEENIPLKVRKLNLIEAKHSRKGNVLNKVRGNDGELIVLKPGDYLDLSFDFPSDVLPPFDYAIRVRGWYKRIKIRTQYSPTMSVAYDDEVVLKTNDWVCVKTEITIPSNAISVTYKIKISSTQSSFVVYVDEARVGIVYETLKESSHGYGVMKLSYIVYCSESLSGIETRRITQAQLFITAQLYEEYRTWYAIKNVSLHAAIKSGGGGLQIYDGFSEYDPLDFINDVSDIGTTGVRPSTIDPRIAAILYGAKFLSKIFLSFHPVPSTVKVLLVALEAAYEVGSMISEGDYVLSSNEEIYVKWHYPTSSYSYASTPPSQNFAHWVINGYLFIWSPHGTTGSIVVSGKITWGKLGSMYIGGPYPGIYYFYFQDTVTEDISLEISV
ncbi:MAG: hypothetical protein ACTSX9_06405 [Candidatus Njordarchaeales archaeon]